MKKRLRLNDWLLEATDHSPPHPTWWAHRTFQNLIYLPNPKPLWKIKYENPDGFHLFYSLVFFVLDSTQVFMHRRSAQIKLAITAAITIHGGQAVKGLHV